MTIQQFSHLRRNSRAAISGTLTQADIIRQSGPISLAATSTKSLSAHVSFANNRVWYVVEVCDSFSRVFDKLEFAINFYNEA